MRSRAHVIDCVYDAKTFCGVRVKWDRVALKRRLSYVLNRLCDGPVHLSICFCDEPYMTQVHGQFKGKQKSTDVLSFLPAQPHATLSGVTFLGDLLVCVPVCMKQAKRARYTLTQELEKMLIHGMVHLKGFDHERSEYDHKIMSSLERALRQALVASCGVGSWCSVTDK